MRLRQRYNANQLSMSGQEEETIMPSPETVKELPSSQRILQMLTGKWIAQAVSVAATLGIADLLVGGPQSVEQLPRQPPRIRIHCIACCVRWPVLGSSQKTKMAGSR